MWAGSTWLLWSPALSEWCLLPWRYWPAEQRPRGQALGQNHWLLSILILPPLTSVFPLMTWVQVFQHCPPSCWYLPRQGAICPGIYKSKTRKWLKGQTVAPVPEGIFSSSLWGMRASLLISKEKSPQSPYTPALVLPSGPLWTHAYPHHCHGQLYLLKDWGGWGWSFRDWGEGSLSILRDLLGWESEIRLCF